MSGTGPFKAAAEADVAAAAAAARSCGEALPRLLGCPLGERPPLGPNPYPDPSPDPDPDPALT